jgi:DNA-binding CsgD family transcriptional regulator
MGSSGRSMQPWEVAERLLRARSMQDLEQEMARSARLLGFEHHSCLMKSSLQPARRRAYDYATHNLRRDAWQALYGGWSDPERLSGDVRIQHARAGLPATSWSVDAGVAHTRADLVQAARAMLRTARGVGMRGGITVPLATPGTGWGIVTFSTTASADLRELAPRVASALYVATCFQSGLERLVSGTLGRPEISERERDILSWVALGKSSWDVARILSISEHTVNYHLQRAARKFNVRGRRAACAQALAMGLIQI